MNDKELKEAIKKIQAYGAKAASSNEEAFKSMEKAGICDSMRTDNIQLC